MFQYKEKDKLRKYIMLAFAFIIFCLVFPMSGDAALVTPFNRAIAIENHLEGHERDPIEGIWLWRESFGNQTFEIAIIPNTFDYPKYKKFQFVGITVDSTGFVKKGETKLLVAKTADGRYEGQHVLIFKDGMSKDLRTFEISFSLERKGRQFTFIVPAFGLFAKETDVRAEKLWPETDDLEGDQPGTGSAFFIAKDTLITNEHVVKGFKSGKISYQRKIFTVDVIARDEANDLALLKVNFNDLQALQSVKPLRIGDVHGAVEGEPVFSIGYPMAQDLGVNPKINMGIINGVTGFSDDPRMFQVSVPLQPGNSGGPLFDENGGMIGVVSSGLNVAYYMNVRGFAPQNVNFAIKADYINNLLMVTEGCSQMQINTDTETYDARAIMDLWRDSVVLVICE